MVIDLEYVCWYCNEELGDEESYIAHVNKLRCICKICGKVCPNHTLFIHESEHYIGTLYKCDYCPELRTFKHKGKLLEHIAGHDLKLFKCVLCRKKAYNTKKRFKKHMEMHWKRFKCDQCPFVCKVKNYLNVHKSQHNSGVGTKCMFCSFYTNNALSHSRHMKYHKEHIKGTLK